MKMLALALMILSLPATAADWQLDPGGSSLTFTYRQAGAPTTGRFNSFTAAIRFDPAHPAEARIDIIVDLASADAGVPDRTVYLAEPDWFDSKSVSTARFTANGAVSRGGNSYHADGMLTIKGISRPVGLDFTLNIKGDRAHAVGSVTLVRLDWDIGSGQYVSERFVGHTVAVDFDIRAARLKP